MGSCPGWSPPECESVVPAVTQLMTGVPLNLKCHHTQGGVLKSLELLEPLSTEKCVLLGPCAVMPSCCEMGQLRGGGGGVSMNHESRSMQGSHEKQISANWTLA